MSETAELRIIVLIKQVPSTNKVDVDPVTGVLKRNGVDSKMNPYDLFALEEALRLREKTGGSVTAVSMGPNQAAAVLREAVCMGADSGLLLSDRRFAGADVLATSRALKGGVTLAAEKTGGFDLIICGKQTTDGDTAQVGPELAEHFGLPHAANVLEILSADAKGITLRVNADYEEQILYMPFPALITADKDINTPRLPSYKRQKALDPACIRVCSLDDFEEKDPSLYGLKGSPTQVERIFPPDRNSSRSLTEGSAEENSAKITEILAAGKFI